MNNVWQPSRVFGVGRCEALGVHPSRHKTLVTHVQTHTLTLDDCVSRGSATEKVIATAAISSFLLTDVKYL